MRLTLVSLAACCLAACSGQNSGNRPPALEPGENVADANAGGDEATAGGGASIDDMRARSLAEIDKEACTAAGGEVRQEGMLGMYRCVKPYADAGKACRSSDDCEGKCLASGPEAAGEEAVGACQANDSPFGCYAEIEDGKVANAICVD